MKKQKQNTNEQTNQFRGGLDNAPQAESEA